MLADLKLTTCVLPPPPATCRLRWVLGSHANAGEAAGSEHFLHHDLTFFYNIFDP
jgi:hypothetical protein